MGAAGVIVILVTLYDVVRTTLGMQGGGPLTERLSKGLWKGALGVHRARPSHGLLAQVGTVILLAVAGLWALLMWLGWTLLFSADPGAVVSSGEGERAGFWGTAYFAGYTVITLGMGDYRPVGAPWQLATVAASFTGFFIVTLSITFLVPVLSSVVQKRGVALLISSLGSTPEAIVTQAWKGGDCSALSGHLSTLIPQLATLGQRHLAYPVLHYFHSTSRDTAIALNLAVLDEALSYLEWGVRECGIPQTTLTALRRTIGEYLQTLSSAFIDPAEGAPTPAPLAPLRDKGVTTKGETAYHQALSEHAERRKLLVALVRTDGWTWRDVREA